MPLRRTLSREITAEGQALHAGTITRMTLSPAPSGSGTVFRRSDLGNREIPARYTCVAETRLGTVISDGEASVGVIEHLMAALAGAGVDDVLVTLDGPEPPILDGDSLSYLTLIDRTGTTDQPDPRRALKILKPVTVQSGNARATLHPAEDYSFSFEIDFPPPIGRQSFDWRATEESFRSEIAPARTFGFVHELEALHKAGLGRGATLENTLAIEGDRVVNAALLRFPDEFVRHKILDALGDLSLAGGPLLARFEGVRSGHALNNALLRAVFADSTQFAWVTAP